MREISVAEQRYKAILAVIGDGKTVTEVAAEWRVSRQTVHTWLARYEAGGLEALGRPFTSAGDLPTSDTAGAGGDAARAAALEAVLGSAHQ
jgi:transposase-like protein